MFNRNCPNCGILIIYKYEKSFNSAVQKNSRCVKCNNIIESIRKCPICNNDVIHTRKNNCIKSEKKQSALF